MQLSIAYPTAGNSLFHSDNKLYIINILLILRTVLKSRDEISTRFKFLNFHILCHFWSCTPNLFHINSQEFICWWYMVTGYRVLIIAGEKFMKMCWAPFHSKTISIFPSSSTWLIFDIFATQVKHVVPVSGISDFAPLLFPSLS